MSNAGTGAQAISGLCCSRQREKGRSAGYQVSNELNQQLKSVAMDNSSSPGAEDGRWLTRSPQTISADQRRDRIVRLSQVAPPARRNRRVRGRPREPWIQGCGRQTNELRASRVARAIEHMKLLIEAGWGAADAAMPREPSPADLAQARTALIQYARYQSTSDVGPTYMDLKARVIALDSIAAHASRAERREAAAEAVVTRTWAQLLGPYVAGTEAPLAAQLLPEQPAVLLPDSPNEKQPCLEDTASIAAPRSVANDSSDDNSSGGGGAVRTLPTLPTMLEPEFMREDFRKNKRDMAAMKATNTTAAAAAGIKATFDEDMSAAAAVAEFNPERIPPSPIAGRPYLEHLRHGLKRRSAPDLTSLELNSDTDTYHTTTMSAKASTATTSGLENSGGDMATLEVMDLQVLGCTPSMADGNDGGAVADAGDASMSIALTGRMLELTPTVDGDSSGPYYGSGDGKARVAAAVAAAAAATVPGPPAMDLAAPVSGTGLEQEEEITPRNPSLGDTFV